MWLLIFAHLMKIVCLGFDATDLSGFEKGPILLGEIPKTGG